MTRDEADAALRSMRWGAQTRGDPEAVARLEALQAELHTDPSELERALIGDAFQTHWSGVNPDDFKCAVELAIMCKEAVANGYTLPRDVVAHYPRKPHRNSLGGWREVAGAFALARGYRRPGTLLKTAAQWVADRGILELGERAGFTYPGLGGR